MKNVMMKMIKVQDAVGSVLSHDVTQIIPGEFKGRAFKKGHIIKEEDIEKLLSIGKDHVYVWEPEEGQLHENDAATRLSTLVVGDGVATSEEIKEGKVDFFADRNGVLKIDKEKLFKLNSLGEIIVSTLHNNTPIRKGEKIGATRVSPLIIDENKIIEAEELIKEKIIRVDEIKTKRCAVITTGNEVYYGRIKDAFLPVIKQKLGYYGSEVIKQVILPDDKERITEEILKAVNEDNEIMMITTEGIIIRITCAGISILGRITSGVKLINLDEAVTTMYPLMEPCLDELTAQVLDQQGLDNVSYSSESKYTSIMLLNAISQSLDKAAVQSEEPITQNMQ